MESKTFDLTYPSGLHARPSTTLSKIAKESDCKITVINNYGERANAHSIISILALGVQPGKVTFEVDGKNEKLVMETITSFVEKLNSNPDH